MALVLVILPVNLLAAGPLEAQRVQQDLSEAKHLLEDGYSRQDLVDIDRAIHQFERFVDHRYFKNRARYYVALGEYRAINVMNIADLRDDNDHLVRMDRAIWNLEQVLASDEQDLESLILLYSFYSRKIGLKPVQGMALYPKMKQVRNRARMLDPTHPRLLLIQAIYDYHAPKRFGGDREKAHRGFLQAASSLATQRVQDMLQPDWGYEDACSWLGISYLDRGDQRGAGESFRRALKRNPEFVWIRDILSTRLEPHI